MNHPRSPRKLLSSAARVGTLVVIGVAETACNLTVSDVEWRESGDTEPPHSDSDTEAETDSDGSTEAVGASSTPQAGVLR